MRGLLDITKEAWEMQPLPYRSVIENVQQMQEEMNTVTPIVKEFLEAVLWEHHHHYNKTTQLQELKSGAVASLCLL